jgi:hypothetical protein
VGIARQLKDWPVNLQIPDYKTESASVIISHSPNMWPIWLPKLNWLDLMTWKACWLIDKGGDYTVPSAMAKVTASTFAQQVTCRHPTLWLPGI